MITSNSKNFDLRKKMVDFAKKYGIKPAARQFQTTPKTVRKWLQRYDTEHNQGLFDRSRRPHFSPNKTSSEFEKQVLDRRRKTPGFGAKRLIQEFDLPVSHNVANRIFREHNLLRKRRKKHHKKNDLRHIKAAYQPFTRFQMDVKHLNDLPNYFVQMKTLGLPAFQYTIREVSTGAQFLAYSQELSKTYATLAVERFLKHLQRFQIDTNQVVIQTDLGHEFDGNAVHYRPGGFHETIEGERFKAKHRFNPPACPNANADVESVHATIETEFFEAEVFINAKDFWQKIWTYQFWYNVSRKNSSRFWKSPLELLSEKAKQIDPRIFLLPPINLSSLMNNQGGYHVCGVFRKNLNLFLKI